MSHSPGEAWSPAATPDLQAALQQALARHFGRSCSITRLERRSFAYRTSYPLEEVDVALDDGTTLLLLFKDLSRQALTPAARLAKPAFLHDPLREIETYRFLLAPGQHGTATCYGVVVDPLLGRYWLFLEKVQGVELYQVGDIAVWKRAARWLAGFHDGTNAVGRSGTPSSPSVAAHLLNYTPDYYRLWMRRAREFLAGGRAARDKGMLDRLEWLASCHESVVARLAALPVTLIHGEFYASNILVQPAAEASHVCPVDWEMAALGPGLIDLAALTAGQWTDDQRTALALEYHAALSPQDGWPPAREAFLEALDCCRLHLAVQWLGWSAGWSPPPEHAWDWWGEALHLAEKLGR